MRSILPLFAACVLSVSTACASSSSGADVSGNDAAASADDGERSIRANRNELVNTGGWSLTSATGGTQAEALRAPGVAFVMKFAGDGISANGGCNDLRGTYAISGRQMRFDMAIATRMSCEDAKNLADRSFVELMNRSFKAELLEPLPYRLRLTSDDGQVLVFEQLPMKL